MAQAAVDLFRRWKVLLLECHKREYHNRGVIEL
jgi:hypothetical protein